MLGSGRLGRWLCLRGYVSMQGSLEWETTDIDAWGIGLFLAVELDY